MIELKILFFSTINTSLFLVTFWEEIFSNIGPSNKFLYFEE